jgi:PAS domain S-box-containing protein/putative nucleotidyltransferase with HDIG domain
MRKTKILVVEDESIVARDIRNMLVGLGYEVTAVVPGAKAAVEKAQETDPDIVLMDVMLQGEITGVEAAEQIYTNFKIPVVYLTAYADSTTVQQAKKTEPFGYIIKPFEERELQTTIEIALYKYKMQMELKDRERWLSTILKSIGDGVIATNKNGVITFMNPLAETLTGWKLDQAMDRTLSDVFKVMNQKPGKMQKISVKKILKGEGSALSDEAILVSKTGKKTPIDPRMEPIKDDGGNNSGVVLAFTDVTARKTAEEELKRSFEQQKIAMEGTVRAIAYTIETRDPYTAGHQRRVTKLACTIGEEMGLSKDRIEGLRMAGELHDIGKIHVPAEILSKPGQISEAEYTIIKTHSQVGHDILKTIEFPWPVARIVLQHHERMDGSGYPSGLKGKDILLEAKILAVADVIEAMATHRPYRPALSIEESLEEISKNKGKLYDPQVADICMKVFKEKKFKFE